MVLNESHAFSRHECVELGEVRRDDVALDLCEVGLLGQVNRSPPRLFMHVQRALRAGFRRECHRLFSCINLHTTELCDDCHKAAAYDVQMCMLVDLAYYQCSRGELDSSCIRTRREGMRERAVDLLKLPHACLERENLLACGQQDLFQRQITDLQHRAHVGTNVIVGMTV